MTWEENSHPCASALGDMMLLHASIKFPMRISAMRPPHGAETGIISRQLP
jgi:hypothetical protein